MIQCEKQASCETLDHNKQMLKDAELPQVVKDVILDQACEKCLKEGSHAY